MSNITILAHDEHIQMDPAALSALHAQLGEAGAEGVMSRTMEELANRLSLVERCYYQGNMDALWKAAKGMIGTAEHVGLLSLAQVASDVADAARGDDTVALAAVLGRLIRLGDRSLTAVWDAPEMSV
ncbi:MAG: hypothetical protein AAFO93_03165 [Pseudomonadota bacterium]